MPGFRPGIHDWTSGKAEIVDGRAKPGHDASLEKPMNP
jgi:hypothetical protein